MSGENKIAAILAGSTEANVWDNYLNQTMDPKPSKPKELSTIERTESSRRIQPVPVNEISHINKDNRSELYPEHIMKAGYNRQIFSNLMEQEIASSPIESDAAPENPSPPQQPPKSPDKTESGGPHYRQSVGEVV